jgi:signal-transduction protein with cAMP-binding, CBS, and nucleotidyltransferase domain
MEAKAAAPGALAGLDSFLYRHRVDQLMSRPLLTIGEEASVAEASRRMAEAGTSSLVTLDPTGRPAGILTERDVLRLVARRANAVAEIRVGEVMSSPVFTVRDDAFVYVALGRMDRLDIRHLVVVDGEGRAVGMITRRALLKLRAGGALVLGDQIGAATNATALAEVKAALPGLARGLLAEDVGGVGAAAVIASVYRDMTMRAAELAEQSLRDDGWGAAPASWCVLALGSGGRGESLLAADQDNAIIHSGNEADDAWFAEAGKRIADTLNAAGIPYCRGGVMAMNRSWRRTLPEWEAEVARWIREKKGEALLNVDIFFDLRAVAGDAALAETLQRHAVEAASRAPLFLRLLAANLDDVRTPLGFFGRFQTQAGRFDIKLGGLFPLVAAARVMSLRHRLAALATPDRLRGLVAAGAIGEPDAVSLGEAFELIMTVLLDQQIVDIEAGLKPSVRVDPRRLGARRRRRLREAFRSLEIIPAMVQGALSGR